MLNVFYRNRVNTCKRLIEQNEFGVNSKSAGNFTSASFTTGKLDTITFAYFMQTEFIN
jgi:hypothetical protein